MQKIDSHNNFLFFTASLIFLLLASGFVGSTPDGEDHLLLQAVALLYARRYRAHLGNPNCLHQVLRVGERKISRGGG